MSGGEKYVYLYSITLLSGCQSVLAHRLRHTRAAFLGQAAGQNGFRSDETRAADDPLAVFFPQVVDQIIELRLLLKISRFRDVKQAVLPLAVLFQSGCLHAELAQGRDAVPRLVKNAAGTAEQFLRAVRRRGERFLVGKGVKIPASQTDRQAARGLLILTHPHSYRFAQ